MAKKNRQVWSWHNGMIWAVLLPVTFCVSLTLIATYVSGKFQWLIPLFFIVQSIIAVLSLECVNYIEHYGIMRKEIAPGKYEKVNPLHSWNANHYYSNLMLFHLQRHSDHHAYASRPYQVLRHFDESPQLPYGYTLMILISLIPPLWFGIMNKRLEEWQEKAYDSKQIKEVVSRFS